MFFHKNFALNGLFPGLVTHRSIANLGQFEIEITIEPVYTQGGGGGVPSNVKSDKYKVKIRITRKGKVWKYEQTVGATTANVLAKVIKATVATPTVSVINTIIKEKSEIKINVSSKNKS